MQGVYFSDNREFKDRNGLGVAVGLPEDRPDAVPVPGYSDVL